jgi:hypothetical protein
MKKRTTPCTVRFFKNILATLLKSSTTAHQPLTNALERFSRVLIQDSTNVSLPPQLAERYPGSRNQTNHNYSQMKLQTTFDLKNSMYVDITPTPFTRNDQAAALDILTVAQQGDLVLRDLGYFTLNSISEMIDRNIFFISRLRTDVTLFDHQNHQVDLGKILKKEGRIDRILFIGAEKKVKVRIVAQPVPPEISNKRRRTLRSNRDRRCNPKKKQLYLCNWTILICNVDEEVCSAEQIANLYYLRWRIETIFKTWKSHCNFTALPVNASCDQVEAIVYARLIFITIFQDSFANQFTTNTRISMQKLTPFVTSFFWLVFHKPLSHNFDVKLFVNYYCQYEKRKRKPIFEKYLCCNDTA